MPKADSADPSTKTASGTSWADPVDGGTWVQDTRWTGGKNDHEVTVLRKVYDASAYTPPLTKPTDPARTEFGRIVDLITNGPVEGLVLKDGDPKTALMSVKIDGTPIQNQDGSWNFDSIYVAMVLGTLTQSYISGLGGVESENVGVAQEVKHATPVIFSVTDTHADACRVKVAVPALIDGQDGTSVDFDIAWRGADGVWRQAIMPAAATNCPLANPSVWKGGAQINLLGLAIDGTAKTITRTKGSFVDEGFFPGQQIQVGGFSNAANKDGVFTVDSVSALVLTCSPTDNMVTESHLTGCSVVTVGNAGSIRGMFNSRYIKGFTINFGTVAGPWDIRVTKWNEDVVSSSVSRSLEIVSVTTIKRVAQTHPLSVLIEMLVDSRKISRVPARTYVMKGRIISVPTNYDPVARTYATSGPGTTSGIWDGTFKQAWTNNPAWIFLDMCINNVYGAGNILTVSNVNTGALYKIAQYCDEPVSDGKGGTEPRFTCNAYIRDPQAALQLLNYLASVFRGALYHFSGSIFTAQDAPGTASILFTQANVLGGKFLYTSSAKKARHTAVKVAWIDPGNAYTTAHEYVEDQAAIARYGLNVLELTAFACTSQGQARRTGLHALISEQTETETVTFSTGLQGIVIHPGQLFLVSDGPRFGARMGGRIVAGTTGSVTVDSPVTLLAGHSYTLSVMLSDGTLQTSPVSNALPYTGTVLSLSNSLAALPQVQGQWILADASSFPLLYRTLSAEENEDGTWKLTGLLVNTSKYASIENGLAVKPVLYPAQAYAAPPANVLIEERVVSYGTAFGSRMVVRWDPCEEAVGYLVMTRLNNGAWSELRVSATSATLENVTLGTYEVRVIAVYPGGRTSPPALAFDVLDGTDSYSYVPPVQNVTSFMVGTSSFLSWSPPASTIAENLTYEVRWGSASWGNAQLIGTVSDPSIKIPSDGIYLVCAKALNTYSEPVAYTVLPANFVKNVVQTWDEYATGFPGAMGAGVYYDPSLGLFLGGTELFDDAPGLFDDAPGMFDYFGGAVSSGTYEIPVSHQVAIDSPKLCNITCAWSLVGVSTFDSVDTIMDWDALPDVDGAYGQFVSIFVEIACSQDGITWGPWLPYTPTAYMGMKFKLRLTLNTTDGSVFPLLTSFAWTVDMPDLQFGEQGRTVSAAGLTVNFPRAYQVLPQVVVTILDTLGTGEFYKITAATKTSFTVTCYNASGVAVARTINWISRGY